MGLSPQLVWILDIAIHSLGSFSGSLVQNPWHQWSESVRLHSGVHEAGVLRGLLEETVLSLIVCGGMCVTAVRMLASFNFEAFQKIKDVLEDSSLFTKSVLISFDCKLFPKC